MFVLELPANQEIGFVLDGLPAARRQDERETAIELYEKGKKQEDWERKGEGNKSWIEEGMKAKARNEDCEAVSSSVHPSVQSIIKLPGNTKPKSK